MNAQTSPASERPGPLAGVRVVEVADEQAEYCGLLLAGLGAEVIKVEPPGGNSTRQIGPFYQDVAGPERSLFFWHYNRTKRSVVLDLDDAADRARFRQLTSSADLLLDSTPRGRLADELELAALRAANPSLVTARMTPFGDTGPWAHWRGSDLVHLALGGPMMNCGYDPPPGRRLRPAADRPPDVACVPCRRRAARDDDRRRAGAPPAHRARAAPQSVRCTRQSPRAPNST